jgi:phosphate transport system substrate-binding protein
MKNGFTVAAWLATAVFACTSPALGQGLDPDLPVYRPADGISGTITLTGSTTMSQLASVWAESFQAYQPQVGFEITVTGSATAVDAVMNGEAQFGMLSRDITQAEVDAFTQRFGYPPTIVVASLEPIAIYVHADNPIEGLTIDQLDAIFSATHVRGGDADTWGDLGLRGEWANRPITLHGRGDNTGSQVYFQTAVLAGGEFKPGMASHMDNHKLIRGVADDPTGIGFAGMIYQSPNVKAVPIAYTAQGPFVTVEGDAVTGTAYPLVRPLQIVVNHEPGTALPAAQSEFLKYIFSRLGQEDVVRGGFQPIPASPAEVSLEVLGLGNIN